MSFYFIRHFALKLPNSEDTQLMTALIYVVKPVKCIYIMPSVIILGNILDPFKISFDKNLGHRSYESFNQVHCFKIANMNWP